MIKQPKFKPGDAVCYVAKREIIETTVKCSYSDKKGVQYRIVNVLPLIKEKDLQTRDEIYRWRLNHLSSSLFRKPIRPA